MRRQPLAIGSASRSGLRQKVFGRLEPSPRILAGGHLREDARGNLVRLDEVFGARVERAADAPMPHRRRGLSIARAPPPSHERSGDFVRRERPEPQTRASRLDGGQERIGLRGHQDEYR